MYIVNILDAAHYKARKCHFSFVLDGGENPHKFAAFTIVISEKLWRNLYLLKRAD